jgi:hypothetical protein
MSPEARKRWISQMHEFNWHLPTKKIANYYQVEARIIADLMEELHNIETCASPSPCHIDEDEGDGNQEDGCGGFLAWTQAIFSFLFGWLCGMGQLRADLQEQRAEVGRLRAEVDWLKMENVRYRAKVQSLQKHLEALEHAAVDKKYIAYLFAVALQASKS